MSALGDLADKVARLYESMVTNTAEFNALRDQTRETVKEIKSLVERLGDEMRQTRLEHVRERALLESKIDALSHRLDALSETALHVTVREMAREVFQGRASESSPAGEIATVRVSPVLPVMDGAATAMR